LPLPQQPSHHTAYLTGGAEYPNTHEAKTKSCE
jgi:hypothetical protein